MFDARWTTSLKSCWTTSERVLLWAFLKFNQIHFHELHFHEFIYSQACNCVPLDQEKNMKHSDWFDNCLHSVDTYINTVTATEDFGIWLNEQSDDERCFHRWETGEWSSCSATCGVGLMTRTVACTHRPSRDSNHTAVLRDEDCQNPKPSPVQACNRFDCPPMWATRDWGQVKDLT